MSALFRSICFALLVVASTTYASEQAALKQLLAEMRPLVSAGNATPIQTVLARHQVNFKTSFTIHLNEVGLEFSQRPRGVSENEWLALQASKIQMSSEFGEVSAALYDLDHDGNRDLIINCYSGGTGLFSLIYTFRREGGLFVSSPKTPSPSSMDNLYSINGRGSDQEGTWINLNQQTYLAYRDGIYGSDTLVLRTPFSLEDQLSSVGLQVDYRYRNYLSGKQTAYDGTPVKTLSKTLQQKIQKALDQLDTLPETEFGQCPATHAVNVDPSDEIAWPWFGAGHYTFDILADFPVWIKGHCGAVRLINVRNSYRTADHFIGNMLMYMPAPNSEALEFEIKTTRKATAIKTFTPTKENTY